MLSPLERGRPRWTLISTNEIAVCMTYCAGTLTTEEWKTEQQLFAEAVSVNSATSARYTIWVKAQSATNDEFDPGSGQTLAACLTHASRTSWLLPGRQRVADG